MVVRDKEAPSGSRLPRPSSDIVLFSSSADDAAHLRAFYWRLARQRRGRYVFLVARTDSSPTTQPHILSSRNITSRPPTDPVLRLRPYLAPFWSGQGIRAGCFITV